MSSTPSTFIAYDVALTVIASLRDLRVALARRDDSLADQLSRAASSIPLNLAEGNRRVGKDRLHSFRIAAGSADEVRAALHVALAWGYVSAADAEPALRACDRLLGMLWRLTAPRAG
ncbi:MAG: four helix bundle protein [Anaeromyxobacteraceae bacterium]